MLLRTHAQDHISSTSLASVGPAHGGREGLGGVWHVVSLRVAPDDWKGKVDRVRGMLYPNSVGFWRRRLFSHGYPAPGTIQMLQIMLTMTHQPLVEDESNSEDPIVWRVNGSTVFPGTLVFPHIGTLHSGDAMNTALDAHAHP